MAEIEEFSVLGDARPMRPPQAAARAIRFAILSDRTGGARPGVFEKAVALVAALKPDFAIAIGDLIEGYTTDAAVLERQWAEVDAMIADASVPFFYMGGNHDLSNTAMAELWRARMGQTYYAFRYGGSLFVVLDSDDPPAKSNFTLLDIFEGDCAEAERIQELLQTDPRTANELIGAQLRRHPIPMKALTPAAISDAQAAWVERLLAEHTDVRWTFVFVRKPAWLYDCANFDRIQAALKARAHSVFSGHEHYYRHTRIDGVDYVQLGPTGGEQLHPGPGARDHIAWVTFASERPEVTNLALDGVLNIAFEIDAHE